MPIKILKKIKKYLSTKQSEKSDSINDQEEEELSKTHMNKDSSSLNHVYEKNIIETTAIDGTHFYINGSDGNSVVRSNDHENLSSISARCKHLSQVKDSKKQSIEKTAIKSYLMESSSDTDLRYSNFIPRE